LIFAKKRKRLGRIFQGKFFEKSSFSREISRIKEQEDGFKLSFFDSARRTAFLVFLTSIFHLRGQKKIEQIFEENKTTRKRFLFIDHPSLTYQEFWCKYLEFFLKNNVKI